MATDLRQSTAASVMLGIYVDNSDGYTPETALSIAASDIRLSKNGATFAAKNDETAPKAAEYGWYNVELDATDTGTLGRLLMSCSATGALPAWREFEVLPANVWDSFYSTDKLQVDVTQIEGSDATTQIDATVWSASSRTLTQTGATVVSAVVGTKVTTYRDTYWDVTLTGLTSDLTDNDEVYLSLKDKPEDADSAAALLVSRTTGIERLNAASTGFTASDAVFTVKSSTSVKLLLSGSSACVLAGEYVYTVKRIAAASSTGERYLASAGGVWDVEYPGINEVS